MLDGRGEYSHLLIPYPSLQEKVNVFKPGDHASTFGGNPLACAAGLAVAKAIDGGLLDNVSARGDQLRAGLKALQAKYPSLITDVRGWGLITGVEISSNVELQAGKLVQTCIDKGLLLVAAGPKVVRFVPPLVVSEAEVDQALSLFGEALSEVKL